jgi:prephenate dehydrogenase
MKVGIRGMGLIGGSFEKAFNAAGVETVDLKDASAASVGGCSLVVVALPPQLVAKWIKAHAGDFAAGATVIDAAGVKATIVDELRELASASPWHFIGAHPMAGKEVSGYANSDAALFCGASMILTPYGFTPREVVENLKAALSPLGFSRFVETDPVRHDEMIAYTSQLAHVVSSAYVRDRLSADHAGFSAGSFQDMTRVATMDPDLWTELFLANAAALEEVLSRLIARLFEYRDAVNSADAVELRRLLAEGRAAKKRVC